mgnify:FL=1
MLNEHNCENCIHCTVCARKEAMQGMINELKTRFYFGDYDGVSRLIPNVDWVHLTLSCNFFDPKTTKKL